MVIVNLSYTIIWKKKGKRKHWETYYIQITYKGAILLHGNMLFTFLIAWHFAISEYPIILSGEQILIKGNSDSSDILAANAVLPLLGGPLKRKNK